MQRFNSYVVSPCDPGKTVGAWQASCDRASVHDHVAGTSQPQPYGYDPSEIHSGCHTGAFLRLPCSPAQKNKKIERHFRISHRRQWIFQPLSVQASIFWTMYRFHPDFLIHHALSALWIFN